MMNLCEAWHLLRVDKKIKMCLCQRWRTSPINTEKHFFTFIWHRTRKKSFLFWAFHRCWFSSDFQPTFTLDFHLFVITFSCNLLWAINYRARSILARLDRDTNELCWLRAMRNKKRKIRSVRDKVNIVFDLLCILSASRDSTFTTRDAISI